MDGKPLLLIGIAALLVGSFSSSAVYRALQKRMIRPTPGVEVVVAARDLGPGRVFEEGDLRLLRYPDGFLPYDVLHSKAEAMKHGVFFPVGKSSFLTTRNLAIEGDEDGLENLITAGMRAVAVSVNHVTSVAGFVPPGSLVDVLVTSPTPDKRGLQTMTVLQRVRVLATGWQMEGNPTKDAQAARVVTLLVTPEDAEKLALATRGGRCNSRSGILSTAVRREDHRWTALRVCPPLGSPFP